MGLLSAALVLGGSVAGASVALTSFAGAATKAKFATVTGGYGVKPKLSFPSAAAPQTLESEVLHQGTGSTVAKGDLLVANYYGQVWGAKKDFDTSFGKALFPIQIGEGKVIKGWDDKLVGTKVGSRVELVIPPADGYGKTGQTSVGITSKSVLVFVIDVVGTYSKGVHGDPHAAVLKTEVNGIKISGPTGGAPTLTVTKSAAQPKKASVTLLARGHGAKVKPGLIVDQYVATNWTGSQKVSTWTSVPNAEAVGNPSQSSILDPLVGVPVGSRVLIQVPKSSGGGPYAFVFDVVAQPKA
ncbi:MAG: peptidylprolyl isomerase FKBP-type [Acidimicrobiaceae bacterium]|nr:peptidylprolyl isomerase FKBP-type [Acidimicrobiaceae bacterium]